MKAIRRLWNRLPGSSMRRRHDDELSAEIESHLRMQTEDNLRSGMSPEMARRAALLKFGGTESVKEQYREQSRLPLFETLWQETAALLAS